jgi:hypothetical protein
VVHVNEWVKYELWDHLQDRPQHLLQKGEFWQPVESRLMMHLDNKHLHRGVSSGRKLVLRNKPYLQWGIPMLALALHGRIREGI